MIATGIQPNELERETTMLMKCEECGETIDLDGEGVLVHDLAYHDYCFEPCEEACEECADVAKA